jgi:mRNA interferase HigB
MHIITHSRLKTFWQKHPNAKPSLQGWYIRTRYARWTNFVELRQLFPSADQVGKFTIFNIGGNNYRLITFIDYEYHKVFIRHVLTHAEYDREEWKNDAWFT